MNLPSSRTHTSKRRLLLPLFVPLFFALVSLASAGRATAAVIPAPALAIRTDTLPTNLVPGYVGDQVVLLVTNVGGAATAGQVTISDTLPRGLTVTDVIAGESPYNKPIDCTHTTTTVSCQFAETLADEGQDGLNVKIGVATEASAVGVLSAANVADVSGGGAAPTSTTNTVTVGSPEALAGFSSPLEAGALDAAGVPETQASGHPNVYVGSEFTVSTDARREVNSGTLATGPAQKIKDVTVDLPAGFVGDPQVAPTCPENFIAPPGNGANCPVASVVGTIAIEQEGEWNFPLPANIEGGVTRPLYNVAPTHGYPAEFAFIFGNQEVALYPSLVRRNDGYLIQVRELSAPRFLSITGAKVTLFGDPAVADKSGLASAAFFTNPSDCAGGPLKTTVYMDTSEEPGQVLADGSPDLSQPGWHEAESTASAPTGCNKLQFNPEIEVKPTTQQTGSPSGLNVNLTIPQDTDPNGLATPDLKNVTVTLPKGLTISPSSANGLQACSDAQFAVESTEPSTCPRASVVGSVKVHTPLLAEELEGQVFVGAPECSPCSNADAQDGRLVRLFIEVANAARGVDVKIPGTVSLDSSTGQLTASFKDAPQLPFDDLKFAFKSGERAPLSTPTACGGYTGSVDLTPWSTPYTQDSNLTPGFAITEGCGAHGFAPAFTAGTTSSQAGAYSPFTLSFSRNDSEQGFKALEATLPPGLLAKLAGVPRCGEAEANAGTCPEGSRIGSVTVGAGPGTDPYYVTGQIYLTGPYKGGPFGETVEVPAVAGPFNLGTVVVRGSIRVNPTTAQATVVSNPFPSILDGIHLQTKTVNVTLDRPGFTFNPTNCAAMAVTGKLVSTQGAGADVSSPFQAVNCASLVFKPVLSASTAGRASKAGGASLDVKVAYPSGPLGTYANIKSVKVDLPKQLPSRLTTLQKACLARVFEANPASCPAASDIGTASAITPLLNVPVSGPAYLVSHGGEAFPDLEIVLQGEGVTLILDGNTDIKKGITSSTFKTIPDAPVSGFELKVPTGKYSVLATDLPEATKYSFCGQSLSMPTVITAQSGAVIKQATKIAVTGCPRAKKAAKKKPKKASKSNRRGK
jgi:hypothetical protein